MRIKPNRISWKEADSLYQLESKDISAVLEQNGSVLEVMTNNL